MAGNVLYCEVPVGEERIYQLDNRLYRVRTMGYEPVIIDFGMSHVQGKR